jgi:hypothetical protein
VTRAASLRRRAKRVEPIWISNGIGAERPDRHHPHRLAIDEAQIAQTLRNRVRRVRIVHAIDHGGSTFGQIGQTHGHFSNKNCSHCNLCALCCIMPATTAMASVYDGSLRGH